MKTHTLEADNWPANNWPASSVWVFIAQAGRALQPTQRPRVRIPLKPRNPFFRAFSQLLKLRFTAMVTYSFHSSNCFKIYAGPTKKLSNGCLASSLDQYIFLTFGFSWAACKGNAWGSLILDFKILRASFSFLLPRHLTCRHRT